MKKRIPKVKVNTDTKIKFNINNMYFMKGSMSSILSQKISISLVILGEKKAPTKVEAIIKIAKVIIKIFLF